MKNLAELKRFVKVGMTFHCEHLGFPRLTGRRTITKVQTNAIRYEFDDPKTGEPKVGWCYYGMTSGLVFDGTDRVTFLSYRRPDGGRQSLTDPQAEWKPWFIYDFSEARKALEVAA